MEVWHDKGRPQKTQRENERNEKNTWIFKHYAYCTIRAKHSALKSDIANVKNEKNDQMPSVQL